MLQYDIGTMLVRTTITFFVLLVITRLLGRKQLSQLTFFNYITGITIGSIAAEIAGEAETVFLNGLVSIIWWSLLAILISYLGLKSPKWRVLSDGQPVIIIKEGKVLEHMLKKVQLNMDDVSMLLREQSVFSMEEVDVAVFEPHGKLSIRLKEHGVGRRLTPVYIPTEIIVDGKVIDNNLKEAGLSSGWLHRQLEAYRLAIPDVFYAEIQRDGSLYIDAYEDRMKE